MNVKRETQNSGESENMDGPTDLIKSRPAETATPIATAIAALFAKLFGVEDADTVLYLALVLSFVPAAVTWLVVTLRNKPNDSSDEA